MGEGAGRTAASPLGPPPLSHLSSLGEGGGEGGGGEGEGVLGLGFGV